MTTTTTTTAPPPPYMPTPSSSSASYTIQPAEQNQNPSHQQDSGMAESKQSYYGQAPDGHPAAQESQQPGFSSQQYSTNGAQNQQQFQQQEFPQQEKARPAAAAAAGGPLTPLHLLNLNPALVDCPVCGERQVTRTEFESGNTTYGWAAGLCVCVGLGCIPFCINGTKNVVHYCGHEGTRLATWHRSGRTDVHVVPRV